MFADYFSLVAICLAAALRGRQGDRSILDSLTTCGTLSPCWTTPADQSQADLKYLFVKIVIVGSILIPVIVAILLQLLINSVLLSNFDIIESVHYCTPSWEILSASNHYCLTPSWEILSASYNIGYSVKNSDDIFNYTDDIISCVSTFNMAQSQAGYDLAEQGMPMHAFNKNVPPGWRPGIAKLPLRLYLQLLRLWWRQTDLAETATGPAMAGRLRGSALQLAMAMRAQRLDHTTGTRREFVGDELLAQPASA